MTNIAAIVAQAALALAAGGPQPAAHASNPPKAGDGIAVGVTVTDCATVPPNGNRTTTTCHGIAPQSAEKRRCEAKQEAECIGLEPRPGAEDAERTVPLFSY